MILKKFFSLINYLATSHGNNNNGYFGDGAYVHSIATFAICEAYGMTRDPKLYGIMNSAVSKIIEGQRDAGGWDYNYGNSPRRDLSVSGWNMQALNAARSASANVPDLKRAIKKAVDDVKTYRDSKTGMFSYSNEQSGSPSLTGVGTLCLIELDGTSSAEFKGAMRYLVAKAKIVWAEELKVDDKDFSSIENAGSWRCDKLQSCMPLYTWYYQTLTFFKSEQNWDNWNRQMKRVLIPNQRDDGHWESPSKTELEATDGVVYSTVLCVLMLEVYYRYFNVSTKKSFNGGGSACGDETEPAAKKDEPKPKTPGFRGISY